MVNCYFASAATLLAITSLSAITIQADQRPEDLRRNDEQQRLRKLNGDGGDGFGGTHFITDTVTECKEVIGGNPPVCVNVCVEVTSVTNGGKITKETSNVRQKKCESKNDEQEATESSKGLDSSKNSYYRTYPGQKSEDLPNTIGASSSKTNTVSFSSVEGVGSGAGTKFHGVERVEIAGDLSGKAIKSVPPFTVKKGLDSSKSSKLEGVEKIANSKSLYGSAPSIVGTSSGKWNKNKVASVGGGVGSGKSSKIQVTNGVVQNVVTSNGGSASHGHGGYTKDDIEAIRSEITNLVKDSDRELIPKFLRLGFHDCVGGCNGCVNLSNADNKGLEEPINAIYPIVNRYRDRFSRADIWAMATLVSADLALVEERPVGMKFPMRYVGRKDCEGASVKGIGGPDVTLPSSHVTTHELLDFFKERFDFDAEETVTIMGVHAVATFHREISGFGVKDKEFGWVFNAADYVLDNRYYKMLVGDDDPVTSAPLWQGEVVHNENGIPSRYQWFHEKNGEDERPIMTSADIALVRDLSDYMHDKNGVEGVVECEFENESGSVRTSNSYTRQPSVQNKPVCPVASETLEFMIEYKNDNKSWLIDFETVLEKMLTNGYKTKK